MNGRLRTLQRLGRGEAYLRKISDEMVADPAMGGRADKRQLLLDPTSGKEVQGYVKAIIDTPPDIVKKAVAAFAGLRFIPHGRNTRNTLLLMLRAWPPSLLHLNVDDGRRATREHRRLMLAW